MFLGTGRRRNDREKKKKRRNGRNRAARRKKKRKDGIEVVKGIRISIIVGRKIGVGFSR